MTQFDSSGNGSTCGKVGALCGQAGAAQLFTSVQEIANSNQERNGPAGRRFGKGDYFQTGLLIWEKRCGMIKERSRQKAWNALEIKPCSGQRRCSKKFA
jgi:hypothetical protein